MPPDLWPHQQTAVEQALAHMPGGFGLFFRMRRGKTRTALEVARNVGARRVLVVAPVEVIKENVWGNELASVPGYNLRVLRPQGSGTKKAAAVSACKADAVMVQVNHESVWRPQVAAAIVASCWDLLIVDESHRAKAPSGKASTFLGKLAQRIPHKLILTGTPSAHSVLDLWAQFRIIDPSVFGDSYVKFRMRYSRPATKTETKDADTYMLPGKGGVLQRWKIVNTDELWSKVWEHAVYVPDEVLDVPPVDNPRRTELEPAAARAYGDLARHLVAEVAGGVVTAANAGVKLLRLQQLAGGTLSVENMETGERSATVVSTAKEDMLAETLADLGDEPVVVFARYHSDLDAIHRAATAAGVTSTELSGRLHDLQSWQRGEVQVLAAQIQAGGSGIDLTRACLAIYYSLGFSLTDFEQSKARFLGPRQTRPVTYDYLISAPVDEYVLAALRARQDVVAAVVERLRGG